MQLVTTKPSQTRLSPQPTPTLEEVRAWLVTCDHRPSMVPIYREVMAD
jgi:hypothetical protein